MNFSPNPDRYVPRVVAPLEPLSNTYTFKQRIILRTVFVKINGQRTVAQIKGQLHLSSKTVDEALLYLQKRGVIEYYGYDPYEG
jgi:predicted HTH transcriptional regulator